MRLLITGASGFIGCQLSLAMARNGHEVVALTRRHRPASLEQQDGIQIARADLAEEDNLPAGPFDALFHCAAAIPSAEPDESALLRINVEAARRIFSHSLGAGATVIVFCSSMSVYGRIEGSIVDENTAIRNPSPYGISKLEGERLLSEMSSSHAQLRALSIRLPGIVGPGSHDNFLSETFARLAARKEAIVRNPEALFNNVVHVDDLARFMTVLLGSLPAGHRVATIGADNPQPIRSVIGIFEAVIGCAGLVRYEHGGTPFLIASERARSLGYRPASVCDSVQRYARTYVREPAA